MGRYAQNPSKSNIKSLFRPRIAQISRIEGYADGRTGVSTRRYTAGRDAVPSLRKLVFLCRHCVAPIVPATAGTRSSVFIFPDFCIILNQIL